MSTYPPLRLRELGGCRPIPEWREVTWAECPECPETMYGPAGADERMWDGEPLVCADCGAVASVGVDEDYTDGDAQGRAIVVDREAKLNENALAGFRRLLRLGKP